MVARLVFHVETSYPERPPESQNHHYFRGKPMAINAWVGSENRPTGCTWAAAQWIERITTRLRSPPQPGSTGFRKLPNGFQQFWDTATFTKSLHIPMIKDWFQYVPTHIHDHCRSVLISMKKDPYQLDHCSMVPVQILFTSINKNYEL